MLLQTSFNYVIVSQSLLFRTEAVFFQFHDQPSITLYKPGHEAVVELDEHHPTPSNYQSRFLINFLI